MVEAVQGCDRTLGVVPIESSGDGTFAANFDLIIRSGLGICAELSRTEEHCLSVLNPDIVLKDVRKVMSHPEILRQCSEYLETTEKEVQHQLEHVAMSDS